MTFQLPAGVVVTDEQLEHARAELAEWATAPQEPEVLERPERDPRELEESLMRWGVRDWRDQLDAPDQPTPPAFDGATFQLELDGERLGAQAERVWNVMRDGAWHTLAQLAAATGDPEASVSARIRDLRKLRFGGYVVARERGRGGQWRYKLEAADTVRGGEVQGVDE